MLLSEEYERLERNVYIHKPMGINKPKNQPNNLRKIVFNTFKCIQHLNGFSQVHTCPHSVLGSRPDLITLLLKGLDKPTTSILAKEKKAECKRLFKRLFLSFFFFFDIVAPNSSPGRALGEARVSQYNLLLHLEGFSQLEFTKIESRLKVHSKQTEFQSH